MLTWESSEIAAAVATAMAAAQWLASPWRDLGVLTLCAAGASLCLARGFPTSWAAILVGIALVLGAVAWARGARHGVGRPGLIGVGMVALALGMLSPFVLPDLVPPGPRERVVEVAVVFIGLCAVVGLPLALERPGPRRPRPFFLRRVAVRTDRDRAAGSGHRAAGAEPDSEAV